MADQARRRQQRSAATAEQLLQAAHDVFASKGYQGATVGAITQAASTAHGTFYLYFRNKQDAFFRVMEQACQRLYEEATAPWVGEPHEVLRAGIRGFLQAFADYSGLWRALLEGSLQDPVIQRMWDSLRQPFVDRIEKNLRGFVDSGVIRELDTAIVAQSLGSMVEWSAFRYFVLHNPSPDSVGLERIVDGLVDTWFTAVYGDTSRARRVGDLVVTEA